jgi:hypothetical protein
VTDFTWNDDDGSILDSTIPSDCQPSRFALTATAVIVRPNLASPELLVCNPHPESWNNWLLPYGSLTIDKSDTDDSGATFRALSSFLQQLRNRERDAYDRAGIDGVQKMLGVGNISLALDAFFENYSLKFSKTANVYTAYLFSYHQTMEQLEASPACPFAWIPLSTAERMRLVEQRSFEQLPIADNVIALLTNEAAVQRLISSLSARS